MLEESIAVKVFTAIDFPFLLLLCVKSEALAVLFRLPHSHSVSITLVWGVAVVALRLRGLMVGLQWWIPVFP